MSRRLDDLTGWAFGRLTVLRRYPSDDKQTWWLCRCDCGNTIAVRAQCLKNANTRSCGCYKKMSVKQRIKTGLRPNGKEKMIPYD